MRTTVAVLGLVLLCSAVSPALAASGHTEGYVPAVAHAEGRFGSMWTSDVWVYHQGAGTVHLWFNPAGNDNADNQSIAVSLDRPVTVLKDVVGSLFSTDGVGSLHYIADGPVTVVSRTWTPGASGDGTYGQTIQGVPITAAAPGGAGQAVGTMRMLIDYRPGFRTNLGLVNVSPNSVSVLVEIFTADGQSVSSASSFSVDLAPFGMRQVNDVFASLGIEGVETLIVRAGVESGNGSILAYLSEVDNTTNDASYQEGFRFGF